MWGTRCYKSSFGLFRGDAWVGDLVVVAVVDALAGAVLLAGELVAVVGGEVAVIAGAHAGVLVVDAGLVAIRAGGATGGDLAVSDALVDAGLLIGGAGGDVMALGVGSGLGEEGGSGEGYERCSEKKVSNDHLECNLSVSLLAGCDGRVAALAALLGSFVWTRHGTFGCGVFRLCFC